MHASHTRHLTRGLALSTGKTGAGPLSMMLQSSQAVSHSFAGRQPENTADLIFRLSYFQSCSLTRMKAWKRTLVAGATIHPPSAVRTLPSTSAGDQDTELVLNPESFCGEYGHNLPLTRCRNYRDLLRKSSYISKRCEFTDPAGTNRAHCT